MSDEYDIPDEDQIIDIRKDISIEVKPKRKGILGAIKNVIEGVETRKEHKKLIKACEEEAYTTQKVRAAEEKLAKELEAAKKRGEYKAKPLTEKIKVKREEAKEKRQKRANAAKYDKDAVESEANKPKEAKKGGIAAGFARGTARMMEGQKREKSPIQITSTHTKPTLTRSTNKKLWK